MYLDLGFRSNDHIQNALCVSPDPLDGCVAVVALRVVGGSAGDERREARRARQARPEVRGPEVGRPHHALKFEIAVEFKVILCMLFHT